MEARLALSAPGAVHVAEATQAERQFLDGLNGALGTNLAFSPAAWEAIARVPFANAGNTDAYKARLRKGGVPFVEGGSVVVVIGAFSGDATSAVDGMADVLRAFRRQNRAYAAHTAAGVLIEGRTIRVLTFLPAKGAKPAKSAGLAASYVMRSVDGLLGAPTGGIFGSGDRKDILNDVRRTLKGLTFEFGPGGAFKVSRNGSPGFFHPDGGYSVANAQDRVTFSGS